MFPGNDLHWQFYYVDRQLKSIFTGGPQLPACKNDDFYWSLALTAVPVHAARWPGRVIFFFLACPRTGRTRLARASPFTAGTLI
jgi:hypothetical protein